MWTAGVERGPDGDADPQSSMTGTEPIVASVAA